MSGNPNPIEDIAGITNISDVSKADIISWAKNHVAQVISDVSTLQAMSLAGQLTIVLMSNGRVYVADPSDTTTLDDGSTCIRDFDSIAYKLIVIDGVDGAPGLDPGMRWTFATSTSMADPSSGNVRFNNAALASVTAAAISVNNTETGNPSVRAWLDTFDDSTTTAHRGYLIVRKSTAPQNFAIYDITGALTDNTTWVQLALTYVVGAGSFAVSDTLSIEFGRTGDTGAAGSNGTDPGLRWLFATSTSMADPSAGNLRLNNATLASVTALAISASTGESGNPSAANFIKTWDDSSTTAHRGLLVIKKASAPQNFAVYDVTAALTDNTTWLQATVAHVVSSGSFSASDVLSIQFYRTGDTGASVTANSQSDQETGTDNTKFVSASTQQFHPSAAKAWVSFTTITTTAIRGSTATKYNIASLTDNGTGDTTITFTTAFSGADAYAGIITVGDGNTGPTALTARGPYSAAPTASAYRLLTYTVSGSPAVSDAPWVQAVFFGDQ